MEPKIRLKGYSGDWETRTLGSLGSVAMCKRIFKNQTSNNGVIPFYKIGTFGSEPDAFISRELYSEYKSKFNYPKKGDILISAAGTIGRTVEYLGEEAYFQDSNIVWLNHNDEIMNSFLKQLYSVIKWKGLEGATIKRLYNNIILETEINMPSIKEQQAIASYFQHLDSLIQSTTKKIESLKQVKAASLQSMFPQEGETAPRVRFKGFEGKWEKKELKEVLTVNSGRDYKHLDKGNIPVYGTSGYMLSVSDSLSSVDAIGIGRKGTIDKPQYLEAPFWTVDTLFFLTVLEQNDLCFLFSFLQRINWKKYDESTGVPSLSKNNIEKIDVPIPTIEEQTAIASYFSTLDTQISLQTQRLEKLKQIKSACLDNMFV